MPTCLVYHTAESANGGPSPFDETICWVVCDRTISIACPYLDLNYLKQICALSRSWRLLTDLEAWLAAFNAKSRHKIEQLFNSTLKPSAIAKTCTQKSSLQEIKHSWVPPILPTKASQAEPRCPSSLRPNPRSKNYKSGR